jgi:hypothetical protein
MHLMLKNILVSREIFVLRVVSDNCRLRIFFRL